jgi:hypothetical protein
MWLRRVELDYLSNREDPVVGTEEESHPAHEDVKPLVPLM